MFVVFACVPNQGFQSPGCINNTFFLSGLTFRLVWTCLFFGPTLLICMVYCHIFHLLKNRALTLVSAEQRCQLSRNIKTVRTTALIVGTFVVGWGPAVVKFVLICEDCLVPPSLISNTTNYAMGVAFNIMFCLKVFTDTFIYAVQLRDVRKALQVMWYKMMRRDDEDRRGGWGREGRGRSVSRFSHTASTRISLHSSR
ncbi:hypothetical protein Pmani_039804 [Petrolisthes manimaculis]|uniref:G-protein coupled receptors family 1 profile domain-containing protein n=1 Tax=Petrolisthes manimaculis TaxID=1843537 RepID=A0AAE1TKZ8_9EUCA|nr:hypothetical protein Pmani_039804 [Petrolisthes manimaculis]